MAFYPSVIVFPEGLVRALRALDLSVWGLAKHSGGPIRHRRRENGLLCPCLSFPTTWDRPICESETTPGQRDLSSRQRRCMDLLWIIQIRLTPMSSPKCRQLFFKRFSLSPDLSKSRFNLLGSGRAQLPGVTFRSSLTAVCLVRGTSWNLSEHGFGFLPGRAL